MRIAVYTTREEALAVQAKVDAEKGFPAIGEGVCQAVAVGGGKHVTHPDCCTVTHARPIEGKTGWAMPVDDEVRDHLERDAVELNFKDWADRKDSPEDVKVAVDAELSPVDPEK